MQWQDPERTWKSKKSFSNALPAPSEVVRHRKITRLTASGAVVWDKSSEAEPKAVGLDWTQRSSLKTALPSTDFHIFCSPSLKTWIQEQTTKQWKLKKITPTSIKTYFLSVIVYDNTRRLSTTIHNVNA